MTHKVSLFMGPLTCILICIIACLPTVYPKLKSTDLTPQLKECYKRFSNATLDKVVGKVLTFNCEALHSMVYNRHKLSNTQTAFIKKLAKKVEGKGKNRTKRQAHRCYRKEYRMMSIQERTDFHRAINGLKKNTIVEPNVYDALAMLHSEMVIFKAHGGPCFLGWHRVYLLMFEMALNDEVPGVCLPYWDSSLDNELDDASQSYMFSPELMGNGLGPVTTGPFAGWRRPMDRNSPGSRQPPLIRNVGVDGQLFTRESIEMILSRHDHAEIIAPNSDPDYDIEVQHGGIHLYVGGDMESLVTSPYDPIFFMHHAFVDYIWELFRQKLKNQMHIDPATNYPMDHHIPFHGRDELMDMADFTCGDGYSDRLMDSYEYELSPSCSRRRPTCNSRFFRCQIDIGRCIPIIPELLGSGPIGPGPIVPGPISPGPVLPGQCAHIQREMHNVKPCQNAYCLNGVCDINQWVYVPVKVVTIRPPGFGKYGSYPVINGEISSTNDIYQPGAYERTRLLMEGRQGRIPRAYPNCNEEAIGQIFVTSQGLNYDGVYKESALIDQRLATTMSIAYIAVKNPGLRGISRVLFRAADHCGRVCRTACKNPRTGLYEPCSGILELDSKPPVMYSMNYGDATMDVWDYGSRNQFGRTCPQFNPDKFFLTFYCDYRDHLPWVDRMTAPTMSPMFAPRPSPIISRQHGCRVSSTCVLDVSCYSARLMCRTFGETHQCRGSCGRYAVCNYGHYKEKVCLNRMVFSEKMHRCSSSRRCQSQARPPIRNWNSFPSRSRVNNNFGRVIGNRNLDNRNIRNRNLSNRNTRNRNLSYHNLNNRRLPRTRYPRL